MDGQVMDWPAASPPEADIRWPQELRACLRAGPCKHEVVMVTECDQRVETW